MSQEAAKNGDGGQGIVSDKETGTLSGIGLFQGLKPKELEAVEKSCSWRRYADHEQIIDRQSGSTDVYFIAVGRVRVVNYSLSGREITLDDLDVGGYFGELAAIDGEPRSASVMALTECLIAALPQERFHDLLDKHAHVSKELIIALARVVRVSTDRIMDLSTLAANNRVQADLLRQARTNMQGDNQASIKPMPVHSDIASRVSTTRETVARVLNDLARQGVVERQKDALFIHDVDLLSDMVEEVRGE